jgi:glucose-1-phosphate thymidylyltransferase
MIYYPLETLLKAGIKEVLIIAASEHAGDFINLLGSGQDFGAKLSFEVQDRPEGLAQAFLIGESFIDDEPVAMILGDNLFEDDFKEEVSRFRSGAKIFVKEVEDAKRFGVVEVQKARKAYKAREARQEKKDGDKDLKILKVLSIEEKPKHPKSNFAMTGFYIFDATVIAKAKTLKSSRRGELEITDLVRKYLDENTLQVSEIQGQWIDMGTFESMYEATKWVRDFTLKLPFQNQLESISKIHRDPRSLVPPQPKAADVLMRKH